MRGCPESELSFTALEFCKSSTVSRRTHETDGHRVEVVEELDALVSDKREHWRAAAAKARRRQRRYGKRLTKTTLHADVEHYDP